MIFVRLGGEKGEKTRTGTSKRGPTRDFYFILIEDDSNGAQDRDKGGTRVVCGWYEGGTMVVRWCGTWARRNHAMSDTEP